MLSCLFLQYQEVPQALMMHFKNEPEFCEKVTFMQCCFSYINRSFRTSGISNSITSMEFKNKHYFAKSKLENILCICLFPTHVVLQSLKAD